MGILSPQDPSELLLKKPLTGLKIMSAGPDRCYAVWSAALKPGNSGWLRRFSTAFGVSAAHQLLWTWNTTLPRTFVHIGPERPC